MKTEEIEYLVQTLKGLDIFVQQQEIKGNKRGINIVKKAMDDCHMVIGDAVLRADPEVRRTFK